MRARLLLLGVALAAFGGSLVAGFHLDDYATFTESIHRVLRGPNPLTHLTLWLNLLVAGQSPLVYHATNLLLHLGAVLLAYECLRRLLPAEAAWIAAAIFAIHPLQAEAVDYASARGAILAAVLCLAAMWAWIDGRPWLAVLPFAFALTADVRCCLFGIVLLAVPSKASGWSRRMAPAVMAALAAAAAVRAYLMPQTVHYGLALDVLRFLRLLIVPWGFTTYPDVHEPVWVAIAAAVAIVAAAVWYWRKQRPLSEWGWFLAGLLLLIPNFFTNPAADTRMYLPMVAFSAAAGLLLGRIPAPAAGTLVVALLVLITMSRTWLWISEERIWREAVRRAPHAALPKIELAQQVHARDALELLSEARQEAPYNPEIPLVAGKILLDEQQYDAAVAQLGRAIALNPGSALAYNNRGVALAALGQIPAATADFEQAVEIDPSLAEPRENLKRLTGR